MEAVYAKYNPLTVLPGSRRLRFWSALFSHGALGCSATYIPLRMCKAMGLRDLVGGSQGWGLTDDGGLNYRRVWFVGLVVRP